MKARIITPKFEKFLRSGILKREDFIPQFINEKWHKPKYSLREQADIRKACTILNINSEALGLPKIEKKVLSKGPPEGTKYQKNYELRKKKVDTALADMPKTILKWKEEKAKEEATKVSNLPF